MKTTLTFYTYAKYCELNKQFEFTVSSYNPEIMSEYILIKEHNQEFEVPPVEMLTQGQVDIFRKQQQELRAKAELANQVMEDKIQSLLCLEAPKED